jgi:hypothetical protein
MGVLRKNALKALHLEPQAFILSIYSAQCGDGWFASGSALSAYMDESDP